MIAMVLTAYVAKSIIPQLFWAIHVLMQDADDNPGVLLQGKKYAMFAHWVMEIPFTNLNFFPFSSPRANFSISRMMDEV